jgi:hypothetical protein
VKKDRDFFLRSKKQEIKFETDTFMMEILTQLRAINIWIEAELE